MENKDKPIGGNFDVTVFADRLLIQKHRIIYFDDIIRINAIPCRFRSYDDSEEDDNETAYFVEVIPKNNKKVIFMGHEGAFIDAFQTHKNLTFSTLLRTDQVIAKFGKTKFWLTSWLFALSPLRMTIWYAEMR